MAALSALTFGSAAAAPPKPPSLPQLPEAQTAHFKVVVEGRARASRLIAGEANNGVCEATVSNGEVFDEYVYGRGKGVEMEAIRFGSGKRSGVLITRAGRQADLTFVVRGTIGREAKGSYDLHPVTALPCPAAMHYDFASNPDCGGKHPWSDPMALAYNSRSGLLQLKLLGLRAVTSVDDCGRAPGGFSALADLPYGWPGAAGPVQGTLPPGKLFGPQDDLRRRARRSSKRRLSPPASNGKLSSGEPLRPKRRRSERFARTSPGWP